VTLEVVTQPQTFTPTTFSFVVPGRQRWTLRSVRADVDRAVGGAPNRAYMLTVTDGTSIVAQAGADDAGTEPGTASITWCNCPAGSVAAGSDGVVVAPVPNLVLAAGYVIAGEILNPAGADAWLDAVVWLDYVYVAA
jgi:hypothetical protein